MAVMKNKKLPKTTGSTYRDKENVPNKTGLTLETWLSIASLVVSILGIIGILWGFSYKFGKLEQKFRDDIKYHSDAVAESKAERKELRNKINSVEIEISTINTHLKYIGKK